MACIDATGALTPVAEQVLRALSIADARRAEDIAAAAGLPLYRGRMSLRELTAAGLVVEEGDAFRLAERGRVMLDT